MKPTETHRIVSRVKAKLDSEWLSESPKQYAGRCPVEAGTRHQTERRREGSSRRCKDLQHSEPRTRSVTSGERTQRSLIFGPHTTFLGFVDCKFTCSHMITLASRPHESE
jgi:hypothetical protein